MLTTEIACTGEREACPVSVPAGGGMQPAGTKSPMESIANKPQTIREFERSLRAMGYSQREAKGIAKQGYSFIGGADVGEGLSQLAESLAHQTSFFLKD